MKIYLLKRRTLKFREKEEMMQRIQLPVKNVASILQRTFLGDQAGEGKAITFIIANNYHAIHRIRVSIPRNEFLAVFASYPLQQPAHHTNPCLFCVFVPLSPFSFRGAHRILPQKAVDDMTCFGRLPMFNYDTLRTRCSMHSM